MAGVINSKQWPKGDKGGKISIAKPDGPEVGDMVSPVISTRSLGCDISLDMVHNGGRESLPPRHWPPSCALEETSQAARDAVMCTEA